MNHCVDHLNPSTMLSSQPWALVMVLVMVSMPLVLGTVDCSECRPMDLQSAPGIFSDPPSHQLLLIYF
jgi:hypothetical protein